MATMYICDIHASAAMRRRCLQYIGGEIIVFGRFQSDHCGLTRH